MAIERKPPVHCNNNNNNNSFSAGNNNNIMFTPRGVTKRLRAAVTGYYVLGITIIIININRPSTICRSVIIKIRLFEIWYHY